jgi:hypothetical protein
MSTLFWERYEKTADQKTKLAGVGRFLDVRSRGMIEKVT